MVRAEHRVLLSIAAFFVCACSGRIADPSGAAAHGGDDGPASSATGGLGMSGNPGKAASTVFAPVPAVMRKLTVEQYQNSVADLLGGDLMLPTDLEPDTAQNGFFAVAAGTATISAAAAEKLEGAAYMLAEQALAPARRAKLVTCTPSASVDSSCSRAFVAQLARRAFRRPVTADEVARYAKVADDAARALNDFYAGLQYALAGILQSPNFLFRSELGEIDPSAPERRRFTAYDLAARLSYGLWNTTPDDALLAAADSGELAGAGLAEAADRLLADPRAKAALDDFHAERLGLADLALLDKDSSVYAGGMNDELRAALRDDVLRTFAEYVTGSDHDVMGVFDGRTAFVNAPLAGIYGLSQKPATMQRVQLPDDGARVGILGKPAFLALAAHSNQTSPTLRGKYIRERFLCQSIGAPPSNVVPVLGAPDPSAPTMRDRLKSHALDPSCAGCHNQMDPLGLALEHFDAIGRYRADDDGHALDTSGNLDGEVFDGEVELAGLLRDDPRVSACLVRQAYRYLLGHIETSSEEPQISDLVEQFDASGHDLLKLLRALVLSDAFRYAAKELAP
jgi:hypothetical protein